MLKKKEAEVSPTVRYVALFFSPQATFCLRPLNITIKKHLGPIKSTVFQLIQSSASLTMAPPLHMKNFISLVSTLSTT